MANEIIIKQDGRGFDVHQGDKSSGHLGYDETIGLVSSLIIPEDRGNIRWMKTKEQHKAFYDSLTDKRD